MKHNFSGYLTFTLGLLGWRAFLVTFLLVLNFTIDLSSLIILYDFFVNRFQDIRATVELLLFLGLLRFLGNVLNAQLLATLRQKIFGFFKTRVIEGTIHTEHMENIKSIVSQDFTLLAEYWTETIKCLYQPTALIIGLIIIYIHFGWLGLLSIATIALFTPLSFCIALKTTYYASIIYNTSKRRMQAALNWLRWRAFIYNWGLAEQLLTEINVSIDDENEARKKDSFWRCLDTYSSVFGRILPAIIWLMVGIFFDQKITHQYVLVYWLSLPFIVLLLEVSRLLPDMKRCFHAWTTLLNIKKAHTNEKRLLFDATWDIWHGSLAENLFLEINDYTLLKIIQKTRLSDELNLKNYEDFKKFQLAVNGTNVSAGQKSRILLVRALQIMRQCNQALEISYNFNSLDTEVALKVEQILTEFQKTHVIHLHSETIESLRRNENENEGKSNYNNKRTHALNIELNAEDHSVFFYLKSFCHWHSLFFLLPAMMIPWLASVLSHGHNSLKSILLILSGSLASIAFVSLLGVQNERATRKWAKNKLMSLLKFADTTNMDNVRQTATKDYFTVVDRISWYVHDVSWYVSVALIVILDLCLTFGWKGLLITVIFCVASIYLLGYFLKPIAVARNKLIQKINTSLSMMSDLAALGNLEYHKKLLPQKKSWVNHTIDGYGLASIKVFLLKTYLNIFSRLFTLMLLVGVVLLLQFNIMSQSKIIFTFTAILSLDAVFPTLLQAVTGLFAQKTSIDRLASYPPSTNQASYPLVLNENDMRSPLKLLQSQYGHIYQLSGESGSGKTRLLQAISGIVPRLRLQSPTTGALPNIFYLNEESFALYAWSKNLTNKLAWDPHTIKHFILERLKEYENNVFLLDEVLLNLSKNTFIELLTELKTLFSDSNCVSLFVDHRIHYENKISISELIEKL